MNDALTDQLEKYLKEGAHYRAHSYNVSGDFLVAVLTRLRSDKATIELYSLMSLANESKANHE